MLAGVVVNHSVTPAGSSAALTSATVGAAGTLIFPGWNTMLNAGTVVVNGTITADGLGSGTHLYGGGAGGRIPLYYNTWLADPAFVLSVSQGLGLILQGQPGTLALLAVGHRARNWRLARFRPACLPAGTRACTVRPYRCGAAAAATS